jgi:hypothetical protein
MEKLETKLSAASTWQVNQVINWLKENNFEHHFSFLNEFNGAMLKELNLLLEKAPDYFYAKLERQNNYGKIPLVKIVEFRIKLKNLFLNE